MTRESFAATLGILTWTCAMSAWAGPVTLVEKGVSRAPVILPADAPQATADAARDLAKYIEKISGASVAVLVGAPSPVPDSAVWVGMHPGLAKLFPGVDLELRQPEELLFVCNGRHLLVAGRDRMVGESQREYGTANAVYTFLQQQLGVRWLWPGPLGEDLVRRDTIALPAMQYRFAPPFRERYMYYPRVRISPVVDAWWNVHQRMRDSAERSAGHSFTDWWERYHKDHPDYFALQPDGRRGPEAGGGAVNVKLCVSNPAVAGQWLENAEQTLRANPQQTIVGAFPNDGGGWCMCDKCRAWDHPNGPPSTYSGPKGPIEYVMLTDRYVKFWNILARGLKACFPGREVYVGTGAYARYRTPPVAEVLEDNIRISFVASFPLSSPAERTEMQAMWKAWADKASVMVYRPNLFWYSGGVWGLPSVAFTKTIEDFPFLARNKCAGIVIDSMFMNYATLGPQLYLMAQLTYDPLQDGRAVLADYYRRGFAAAADGVAAYFRLMEEAHDRFVGQEGFKSGGGYRFRGIEVFQEIYTDEFLQRAEDLLREADARVADGPEVYRQRVAFVRSGLEFTRLQVGIMRAMVPVRASKGRDAAAVRRAVELCDQRERFFQQAPPFAVDGVRTKYQIQHRGMLDYLGPPSESLLKATRAEDNPDIE